jgi:hypothetical protein
MNWSWLTMFLSADKVGGYVRAGVAGLLADLVLKYPGLADTFTPNEQTAIATAVAGLAVGFWSHVAKNVKDGSPGSRSGGAIGAVLLTFALWNGGTSTAIAQTKPILKAPPVSCTVTNCKAFYVLADITTHATNVDIIGSGINGSLMAGGATPHIGVGGFAWNGTYSYGVEAACGYSFNVSGPGVSKGYDCYQEIQLGGNLSGLFGITPATPPANFLTQAMMFPYIAVGPEENATVKTGWRAGASVKFMLDPTTFIDIGYRAVNGGNQTAISGAVQSVTTTDNQVSIKLQKAF